MHRYVGYMETKPEARKFSVLQYRQIQEPFTPITYKDKRNFGQRGTAPVKSG